MENVAPLNITECQQCGTCCRKGGPCLHHEDMEILRNNYIGYEQLITIRKGEPAYNPASGKLEATSQELIKIQGTGTEWMCRLFDPQKSICTIYEHRPRECRLLKCWDTKDLLSVIGVDTISRHDIINPADPILKIIHEHEQLCPTSKIENLTAAWPHDKKNQNYRTELAELAHKDLAIRTQAVFELGLPQTIELFVFGRPLFKQLAAFGLSVEEKNSELQFKWG